MNVDGIVLHPTTQTELDTFLSAPAHAVLLSGPRGSGKSQIAQAVAATLLGTTLPALENHPYFRAIVPQKDSISIEQIRELIGFFRLKVPGTAMIKRVAVLKDADMMGVEAQNALLKMLEEPPADSVLVLTSSQPQSLLATIRSRTQLLYLPGPETDALRQHFTAAGHSEATVSAALLRGGSNIAEAERLLSTGSDAPDTSVQLVKQVLGGSTYDRLLLVDGMAKQKEAASEFVDTLASVAMASLEAAAAKRASSLGRWKDVLQAAHTAQVAFGQNGNAKLVLTELMLSL